MEAIRFIEKKGKRLGIIFNADAAADGLRFLTQDEDFLQVGLFKYEEGKRLHAHRHLPVKREGGRTQECFLVLQGLCLVSIYDEEDRLEEEVVLGPHAGFIAIAGGHGFDILETGTIIIECKNGPFLGVEQDKVKF